MFRRDTVKRQHPEFPKPASYQKLFLCQVECQLRQAKSELLTKLQHQRDEVEQRCLKEMAASKQHERCLLVAQGEATSLRFTLEKQREALR